MSYHGDNWSQAETRRPAIYRDQHGRQWAATVEKRSGYPVGTLQLLSRTPEGQMPPWLPDQRYFVFSPDNQTHLTIDYPTLLRERTQAHAEYLKECASIATARDWPAPVKGETIDHRIIAIVGKAPYPIEPVAAAMQGNRWILGLTDTVDPRLVEFVSQPTETDQLLADLPDFSDGFEEEDEPVDTPPVVQKKRGRPAKAALSVSGEA